jgi:hypothetical protein
LSNERECSNTHVLHERVVMHQTLFRGVAAARENDALLGAGDSPTSPRARETPGATEPDEEHGDANDGEKEEKVAEESSGQKP